jgi:hypothetical protein
MKYIAALAALLLFGTMATAQIHNGTNGITVAPTPAPAPAPAPGDQTTGRSNNTFSGTRPMGDGTTDCSTTSGTNVTFCPPDNRSAGSRSNTAAPRTDAAPQ